MLRTCRSGCGLVHSPPYGSRCKTVIAWKMAGKDPKTGEQTLEAKMAEAGFTGREDPKYLEYLEQQMIKSIESQTEESRNMTQILARLERIEAKQAEQVVPVIATNASLLPASPPDRPHVPANSLPSQPAPPLQNEPGNPFPTVGLGAQSKVPLDYHYQHEGLPSSTPSGMFPPSQPRPYYRQSDSGIAGETSLHVDSQRAAFNAAVRGSTTTLPRAAPFLPHYTVPMSTPAGDPNQLFTQSTMPRTTGPATSDVVSGALSSALQQLSLAIDPTPASSSKGLVLRPEFYVQHKDQGVSVKSLDHTKLSYKQLVYGMGRIAKYLLINGGDFVSYLDHYNFVTMQASRHNFMDIAFVEYDRYIVDRYLSAESDSFTVDSLGVASHFHAGNMRVEKQSVPHSKPRYFHAKGKKYIDVQKDQVMPEGFPEDVCYNFNYKTCTGKCNKSHVCRSCKGKHSAVKCPGKQ